MNKIYLCFVSMLDSIRTHYPHIDFMPICFAVGLDTEPLPTDSHPFCSAVGFDTEPLPTDRLMVVGFDPIDDDC